jgi:activator of HSP90 ATPase
VLGTQNSLEVKMTYEFEQSVTLPAAPADIYDAWLSSSGHTAMTGGAATVDPLEGGAFTAWDGYIWGRNLALEPHRRILQSWRTSEFADTDADSTIEVVLEPVEDGTLLRLTHSNIPEGHLGYEDGGWRSQYFEPMIAYFGNR